MTFSTNSDICSYNTVSNIMYNILYNHELYPRYEYNQEFKESEDI